MSPTKVHQHSKRDDRPPKPKVKPTTPIEKAVKMWLSRLPTELQEITHIRINELISCTPKRWVVYPPMVLLPPGSFGEEWRAALGSGLSSSTMEELWKFVLESISKREGKGKLTHLAINSGIPLTKDTTSSSGQTFEAEEDLKIPPPTSENILRTPSGLIMLYGDFGPALPPDQTPTERDFQEAFWVSTKQNGIVQIWAPRYTMFSRGNVKEKARILDFHNLSTGGNLESRRIVDEDEIREAMAVDLYAGIGYFVFSYAKLGFRRVVGWELNPWSVEGLRRGAGANGWGVKVIRAGEVDGEGEEGHVDLDMMRGGRGEEEVKILVFEEDNVKALERLRGMEREGRSDCKSRRVMHVNCGLLPTSELSWEMAIRILRGDGWLHLHENVGVDDIQTRRSEIEDRLDRWLLGMGEYDRLLAIVHVEMVKSFAPGVWHCVFDVFLGHRISGGNTS